MSAFAPRTSLPLEGPLVPARFVARPNRFLLHVALEGEGGEPVEAHMADPGRLKELLLPGARLLLRPAEPSSSRRTRWTAVLVETPDGRGWVSLDTMLPNRLVHQALADGVMAEFGGWSLAQREWTHGRSRLDFLLAHGQRRLALEVKSVTLVEDGVALFPDAVTARGARHVEELAELAARPGWQAAILFVLQRDDARRIVAAESIDPAFARALAAARTAGVRVLGRRCRVTPEAVHLGDPVPAE